MFLIREVVARARGETLADLNVDVQYFSQPRPHLQNSQMSDGRALFSDRMLEEQLDTQPAVQEDIEPEETPEDFAERMRTELNQLTLIA